MAATKSKTRAPLGRRVVASVARAVGTLSRYARRGWPGRTQLLGCAVTLAGIYLMLGLSATLIIGGVGMIVGGTLREGGKI